MHQFNTDTISAIATARGQSALAIIRLSGEKAIDIADACFSAGGKKLTNVESHTAHFGYIRTNQGEAIDQVVATVFKSPNTATGEDIVEVTCHGGDIASQLILRRFLDAGARLAEPGEFTQRAFLNGKVDLAQAEAIADLIHASSALSHKVSLSQLQGNYSDAIQKLRAELLHLCAMVELELDFSEEDVEFANRDQLEALLNKMQVLIADLLASYNLGMLIRDGVKVVIAGRPNAGKSTLLNALVGHERAIVSDIAGTTRDQIEAEAEIEGLVFKFIDTAGLRETSDIIEAEGVRRAEKAIHTTDVLLYVYDVSAGQDQNEVEFLDKIRKKNPALKVILLANKADLIKFDIPATENQIIFTSKNADYQSLKPIHHALVKSVATGLSRAENSPIVVNQRHRQHLVKALEAVDKAKDAFQFGVSGDLLALDLRVALHELGAITGKVSTEDILGEIFSNFCIGK